MEMTINIKRINQHKREYLIDGGVKWKALAVGRAEDTFYRIVVTNVQTCENYTLTCPEDRRYMDSYYINSKNQQENITFEGNSLPPLVRSVFRVKKHYRTAHYNKSNYSLVPHSNYIWSFLKEHKQVAKIWSVGGERKIVDKHETYKVLYSKALESDEHILLLEIIYRDFRYNSRVRAVVSNKIRFDKLAHLTQWRPE